MVKRLLTSLIGLPLFFVVLIFGNKYIMDVIVAVMAIVGIYEYMKCVSNRFHPVSWLGFILAIMIAFLHIIPSEYIFKYLGLVILSIVAILYMHVVFSEMKINFVDIAVTLFGIVYVVGCFAFVTLLYGYESDGKAYGKFYLLYLFLATWGSDIFAYLVGMRIGKHKFSKISPKKSIEGCIAGVMAGFLLTLGATFIFNNYFGMNVNYLIIGFIGLLLTVIGQIGDISASSIKRYVEIKDFSNLIPGHGGMIDRFDSVIFAAPFAYYLITLLI